MLTYNFLIYQHDYCFKVFICPYDIRHITVINVVFSNVFLLNAVLSLEN